MSQFPSASPSTKGIMLTPGGGSRLEVMRAQIQQKQMQEKEQKLLQMLDSQQQRAMQKANLSGVVPPKYSNGNGPGIWSNNSSKTNTPQGLPPRTSPTNHLTGNIGAGAGKVRQMFEDRRKGGPVVSVSPMNGSGGYNRGLAGIDKSYPLDPLDASKAAMTRSGSSKSDPPNYVSYTRGRVPIAGTKTIQAPKQHARSRPVPRTTPTPPPSSGTKQRGISLDRSSGRMDVVSTSPSPIGRPGQTEIGIRRSSSGFAIGNSRNRDENANELVATIPPALIPKTTKYRDYADDLESRESALGAKMKQLNIGSGVSQKSTSDYLPSSASSSSLTRSPVHKTNLTQQDSRIQMGKSKAESSSDGKPSAAARKIPGKDSLSKSKRSAPPEGFEECHVCHRNFASDRISKHEMICKKASMKKRKVFDPTKMRMEGTEAEPYLRQVSAKSNKKAPPPPLTKKLNWRKQHEDFINTIRAAKVYSQHIAAGGNPADLPPPPPADTSDYHQCPHCGRKFSQGAAERHIPKCKNIKSNKR